MKQALQYISLLLIGLVATICLRAQSFQIKVNAKEIGKEDLLEVSYEVIGTIMIEDFKEPIFEKWKIVSGPSFLSQDITINGSNQSKASYNYTLQPLSTGPLGLPGTFVTAGNRRMSCNPIIVNIKKAAHVASVQSQQANSRSAFPDVFPPRNNIDEAEVERESLIRPNENAIEKISKNLFVKALVSKTNCVVGEPVLVTYKLYTRLHSQSRLTKQPSFSGCSVTEMTADDLLPEFEKVGGRNYKVYIIRRVQIVPLQEGALKLDNASIENKVSLYRVNGQYAQPETQIYTANSDAIIINVSALPENKPTNFSGAIGSFTIDAQVNKLNDTANENNSLQIIIDGGGNFQSVQQPIVSWPAGVEHYDATVAEQADKLSFPIQGRKVFKIPFVATKQGEVTIPEISFSYFNMDSHTYKTVHSNSVTVKVGPPNKKGFDIKKVSANITNYKYILILPAVALLVIMILVFRSLLKKKSKPEIMVEQATDLINNDVVLKEEFKLAEVEAIVAKRSASLTDLLLIQDDRKFYTEVKATVSNITNADDILIQQILVWCNENLYSPFAESNRENISLYLKRLL